MIDVIGLIFPPASDEPIWPGADPLPSAEPLSGWHVNVTPAYLADRPELEPFVVTPETMNRVWAGDDPEAPTMTVALRFADEEAAAGYLPPEPAPEPLDPT
jgi:hypothetical protein